MRPKDERITIRLPEKDLRQLDSFLENEEEFNSRSEFLRQAASELINKRLALQKGESEETFVALSDSQINALDYLIRLGRFKSREAALFEILRNFLDDINWDKIEGDRKKLQDIKYQVESARTMDKRIEDELLRH